MAKATAHSNGKHRRGSTKPAAAARHTPRRRPLSLEDSIVELAVTGQLAEAAAAAIRAQKKAGLPVTFLEGNNVIREHADGRREVLRRLKPAPKSPIPKGVKRIPSNGRSA